MEPNRIDLLTHLETVENEQIFANSIRGSLGTVEVNLIAFDDLLEVKRRSSRLRDQADAAELEQIVGISENHEVR